MHKRITSAFLSFTLLLSTFISSAQAFPIYSGFTTRNPGYIVQASDWNNEFGNFISYVNTYLTSVLILLTAQKGNIVTTDGTNPTVLTNAGSADNGKFLSLNSAQPYGLQWATLVGGVTALTTLGDSLVYGPSGLTRLPAGANGTVLTADSTQPNGIAYEPGIPSGSIMLWYGAATAVPTGWYICNGQTTLSGEVTPNLQGVFVMGAGNQSPAQANGFGLLSTGTVGGATGHAHNVYGGAYTAGNGTNQFTVLNSPDVTSYASNAPSYVALFYIMKN